MTGEREPIWASMLIANVLIWALHFSLTAKPLLGWRALEVAASLALAVAASIKIWRGR